MAAAVIETKVARLCDGLIESGWLAAIIAVPLFFNIHSERVFEPDKLTLLRSITLFMVLLWSVKFVDGQQWRDWRRLRWRDEKSIWREPLALPVLGVILVYVVSSLFSITPRVSWLGSYQRLQGTYTTLSYVAVFVLTAATLRSFRQVERVVTAVIITSIPVAFYGLIQHFGLDPLPWGGDVTRRIAGHMGNAIFVAAYLIMVVPLTLSRIIDAFTNILSDEELAYSDVVRSAIYIFVLAIQLLSIYWTGSRGPLIGIAVAIFSFTLVLLVSLRNVSSESNEFRTRDALKSAIPIVPGLVGLLAAQWVAGLFTPAVAFALFIFLVSASVVTIFVLLASQRGWKWLWLSWILLTGLMAVWLLLFNIPSSSTAGLRNVPIVGGVFDTLEEWKELPIVGSYGKMLDPTITTGREKTNRVRVLIWEGVVDLISPHAPLTFPNGDQDRFNFWRPLIGYGPESMYVAYNSFYPPELATVEARNASPDRAHNETFDALVITGVLGLLAWQALYLGAFYYGFRYLRVVRTRRDFVILIAAWVGGGVLGALVSGFLDVVYLGVAIPTGTIVGLVAYLIYYALVAGRYQDDFVHSGSKAFPFRADQLLMNALLAAILAHYVEIHFGIAIGASRLHLFLYMALMVFISYKLPSTNQQKGEFPSITWANRARGAIKRHSDGLWGPVLLWTSMISLIVGILGYEFTNYVLPPNVNFQSGADISAFDIFRQSFFVNSAQGFLDSPFIFLLMILAWLLGCILVLAEMVRQGELHFVSPQVRNVTAFRTRLALGIFALLAVGGLVFRFLGPAAQDARGALGRSLTLLGSIACAWVVWRLYRDPNSGRLPALAISATGMTLALPMLIAGEWQLAALLALVCLGLLYMLWDKAYRTLIGPPLLLAALSLTVGLLFTYWHSVLLREALLFLVFFQGIEPISGLYEFFFRPSVSPATVEDLRILEVSQAKRLLSSFYIYTFSLIVIGGLAIAWRSIRTTRASGSLRTYAMATASVLLFLFLVAQTNLQVVQADMVYKRGRPFDAQAARFADANAWDTAIAIYDEALNLAPFEDFYYLFLGRAYLERSGVSGETGDQIALMREAERRLLEARAINPLNTDHTANLARLNTRWAVAANDESRIENAEDYYRQALRLSPQNSVIRNEFARLAYELQADCAKAIGLYQDSIEVDPFYSLSYFGLSDTLVACAAEQDDAATRDELYALASEALQGGLEIDGEDARAWLQAGQIFVQLGQFEEALEAFAQARIKDESGSIALWNLQFLEADVLAKLGENEQARDLAETALQTAPAEAIEQIELFIQQLQSEP